MVRGSSGFPVFDVCRTSGLRKARLRPIQLTVQGVLGYRITIMDFTRLYLVRHGQVVGYPTLRFNGHTDVDLTPVGVAQMEAVAEDLADVAFDAVFSSDLKRARYGGEALVRTRDMELGIRPEFRELGFGDWEGMSREEIEEQYPGELDKRQQDILNHRINGAETVFEFWTRVSGGLDTLIEENQGKTLALVAHSGVNRAIIMKTLGSNPDCIWRLHQDFGCLNILEFYPDGYALVRMTNKPNRVHGTSL